MRPLLISLGALLVLGAGPARADFMDWSYSWGVTPGPVFASATGSVAMALDPAAPPIQALVKVSDVVSQTPEPSSLALGGAALCMRGLARARRRARARAAALAGA